MANDEQRPEQPFLYDAFISYRHVERDRKWAAWLIKALETYRVPKALHKKGFPSRLRKVFRDEDEIPASSDLNDQIKQALRASRNLIVVCSRDTPESKWVSREVELFQELGRGDRVLALLVDGEPDEAFPKALRERRRSELGPDGRQHTIVEEIEPLAADVRTRPDGKLPKLKHFALLRLMACLIGCTFDDLRQRDRERRRQKQLTWGSVAATLFLLTSIGSLYWWDRYVREKSAYYQALIWRWGLPEGLGAVDTATRSHVGASFEVVSRAGKVRWVRQENSAGVLSASDPSGDARWEVVYREDGSPERIRVFNQTDQLVREEVFKAKDIVSFEFSSKTDTFIQTQAAVPKPIMFDPSGGDSDDSNAKTEITRHRLIFDANGFVAERLYQNEYGSPRRDAQGSFGERFTYSPEGLKLQQAELGADGQEITLKTGIRVETFAYAPDHTLVGYTFIGDNGAPIDGPEGFASYVERHDRWGDTTSAAHFHANGSPALSKQAWHRWQAVVDAHGNIVERTYFDADGKPATVKNGYTRVTWSYDELGHPARISFFGVDGKPALDKDGYASWTQKYDAHGNLVETANFDVDGKPTIDQNGVARLVRLLDDRGNIIGESYFGVDGKPTLSKDGYAAVRSKFDERGNVIERSYFGIDGAPILRREGYAIYRQSFDERGNLIERSYFGIDGAPILAKNGYAIYRQSFDERGNLTEQSYFGVDGKPTLGKDGYALLRSQFDARGNLVEQSYFGVDGKPSVNKGGYALFRAQYDARGNQIEENYAGADGAPTLIKVGYAKAINAFDNQGNGLSTAVFGVDGKPTIADNGCSRLNISRDERGRLVEAFCIGVDGRLALSKSGSAILRRAYDSRGNTSEESYFGVDGKPTLEQSGYASFRQKFDERDNLVEGTCYGVDGKPTVAQNGHASFRQKFDERDNIVEATYYGVDGKPMLSTDGTAGLHRRYDPRGNMTEEFLFRSRRPAHAAKGWLCQPVARV